MKLEPRIKRFEDKYIPEPNSGCWLWVAANSGRDGYGVFVLEGKNKMKAHRASWIMFNGAIPDGHCVMHKCDTPACVNPNHLSVGLQSDNIADMVAKGRARSSSGESHWNAKVADKDISEIKALKAAGAQNATITEKYGIKKSQIANILAGRSRA